MTVVDILFWTIASILVIQSVFVANFVLKLLKSQKRNTSFQPKAAIVLCLRGSDPFLRECITSLLGQDYADYQLHIVADSEEDPCWEVLREFRGHEKLEISILQDPPETCSLKCSSVVQAIRGFDESIEIVALCDADAAPHPQWLANLVMPLEDAKVGVATGGRWYVPQIRSMGSIVRYLWNVAATVNMVSLKIAWGGSLAIRRSFIDQAGLLEKWSEALCEDTMLYGELRKLGLRQAFVPQVMMINRETCSLQDILQWVPRQMLTAKLYHPHWMATLGYGIISVAVPLMSASLIVYALAVPAEASVVHVVAALLIFEFVTLLLVGICEWSVRRRLRVDQRHGTRFGWLTTLVLAPAILLSQLIVPFLYWRCFMMSQIQWRGIAYTIAGRRITRHLYCTYLPIADDRQSL